MKSKVFVSYKHRDRDKIIDIVNYLENANIPIWFDEFNIKKAYSFKGLIENAIQNSSHFLFFMGSDVVKSNQEQPSMIDEEMTFAKRMYNQTAGGYKIIPVRYARKQSLPKELKGYSSKIVDLYSKKYRTRNLNNLVSQLKDDLNR